MAGITSAVVGLAGAAASVKKQKDAKKAAEAQAKAAEAQARAEEAKAAQAAAAQPPAQPSPATYPQQGAQFIPYGAPVYYPQPAAYAPSYYGAGGMMPGQASMAMFGGGYPNNARAQSRSRESLTREDPRALQLQQFRQILDSRLTDARAKLATAERNYQNAYRSGDRANAQAWYQYHQQLADYIAQLEQQKIQYA